MYMARTFMVHASPHWSEQGIYDFGLWGFAAKHTAWVIIVWQTGCQVLLCWNYSPRQRQIIRIYTEHMCGVVLHCP
ncbi:hypothetical protein ACHAW6_014534 [Cyclotella cf. meneghiniana]